MRTIFSRYSSTVEGNVPVEELRNGIWYLNRNFWGCINSAAIG